MTVIQNFPIMAYEKKITRLGVLISKMKLSVLNTLASIWLCCE